VLEIRNLTKRFGRTEVVKGVSFRVGRGQVFGLLGPNGAGKTTTLACALGLLRPTGGEARVFGRPARRLHEVRGRVGAVFDRAPLLGGLSVRANLEYARRFSGNGEGRGPEGVLELVGLTDRAKARAGTLSLGQARRLSIATALLGGPELLVLDEPLSGLDTPGVRSMLTLFRELAHRGLSLVLSSHRLHEMETVITHAAVMIDGRIEREGSLEDLLGEGRGRFLLRGRPVAKAREILEGITGVETIGVDGDELSIRLREVSSAKVNRALVEGGCEVSLLQPSSTSLQSVFEDLLDAPAAAGGPS
jgi:ABC-2 type transport system ATP-binding protein